MKSFLFIFFFSPFFLFAQNVFSDVTSSSGIDNIYDVYQGLFGGGVVAFDYNKDGYEDLFITGGQGQDVLYKIMVMGLLKMSQRNLVFLKIKLL